MNTIVTIQITCFQLLMHAICIKNSFCCTFVVFLGHWNIPFFITTFTIVVLFFVTPWFEFVQQLIHFLDTFDTNIICCHIYFIHWCIKILWQREIMILNGFPENSLQRVIKYLVQIVNTQTTFIWTVFWCVNPVKKLICCINAMLIIIQ